MCSHGRYDPLDHIGSMILLVFLDNPLQSGPHFHNGDKCYSRCRCLGAEKFDDLVHQEQYNALAGKNWESLVRIELLESQ